MSDWWKAPVLQGEDNDYGQYDYLIEELPKNKAEWWFTRYKNPCNSCGKESHLCFHTVHYFYTLDGWDCMDYTECWKCMVKDKLYSIKRKVMRPIKTFKTAIRYYKSSKHLTFIDCYKLAKRLEKGR